MATVSNRLTEMGITLGAPLTNETPHRDASLGDVQQFRFGDVRIAGSEVEVYDAAARRVWTFVLREGNLEDGQWSDQDYYTTSFMNYRSTYDRRPTLVSLTHGLVVSGMPWDADDGTRRGYASQTTPGTDSPTSWSVDWVQQVSANMARELNAAGSMVHLMWIDWASQSPGTSAPSRQPTTS
jgi:hypothetical protein